MQTSKERMSLKSKLREWIGDDWGPMLGLFALLNLVPVVTLSEGQIFVGLILYVIFVGPFIAFVILRHYRNTPSVKAFVDTIKALGFGLWALVKVIAGVGAVVTGLLIGYLFWYPHEAPTLVYTNGNWMQGEKRSCVLATVSKPYQLDCTVNTRAEEPHQFDVTYTGADPADQDKNKPQSWTCTREASSISCKKQE